MGHNHDSHAPGETHEPVVLDPEHDIDARSATLWVVLGTIVLFISLWMMLPIFERVQDEERMRKINTQQSEELINVLEAQQQFLDGANPTKKSISQSIKELATGK
jgi:beta-lactamase regulating signal transducer with metallopeptidase domain